jgi:hypothetical protein
MLSTGLFLVGGERQAPGHEGLAQLRDPAWPHPVQAFDLGFGVLRDLIEAVAADAG